MIKKKYSIIILLIKLSILLLLFLASFQVKAQAIDGKMDLSQHDFKRDGIVAIDGEWEFFYNKLLYPDNFKNNNYDSIQKIVTIPSAWNDYEINNKKLAINGFATYRLIVKLPKKHDVLALKLQPQSTAYKLFVNGREIESSGKTGTNKQTSTACYENKLVFIN